MSGDEGDNKGVATMGSSPAYAQSSQGQDLDVQVPGNLFLHHPNPAASSIHPLVPDWKGEAGIITLTRNFVV